MKALYNLLAGLTLAAIFATSCTKDAKTIGSDSTMAFFQGDNELYTDTGLTYNIISAPSELKAEFGTRVWVECELEDCLDEEKGIFNVNVTNWQIPICHATVDTSAIPFDIDLFKDAIHVNNAWISGGYLNMYCAWFAHKNSGVKQETALLYCGADKDTLNFSVVHNCNGDGYRRNTDTSTLQFVNKMTTFPIQDFIPDGNAVIKLSWLWHRRNDDGLYVLETEEVSATYTITQQK